MVALFVDLEAQQIRQIDHAAAERLALATDPWFVFIGHLMHMLRSVPKPI